jgi:hypothetical protein
MLFITKTSKPLNLLIVYFCDINPKAIENSSEQEPVRVIKAKADKKRLPEFLGADSFINGIEEINKILRLECLSQSEDVLKLASCAIKCQTWDRCYDLKNIFVKKLAKMLPFFAPTTNSFCKKYSNIDF